MNEITITLTGDAAAKYLANERLEADNICRLSDALSNLTEDYAELKERYDNLVGSRVKRDSELAKDLTPVTKVTNVGKFHKKDRDIRAEWENLVGSGRVPSLREKRPWIEDELEVIKLAVGKHSEDMYGIPTLAKYLCRTETAVKNMANNLGFRVRKNFIRK